MHRICDQRGVDRYLGRCRIAGFKLGYKSSPHLRAQRSGLPRRCVGVRSDRRTVFLSDFSADIGVYTYRCLCRCIVRRSHQRRESLGRTDYSQSSRSVGGETEGSNISRYLRLFVEEYMLNDFGHEDKGVLCVYLSWTGFIQLDSAKWTATRGNAVMNLGKKAAAIVIPTIVYYALAKAIHPAPSHQGHAPGHGCRSTRMSGRLAERRNRDFHLKLSSHFGRPNRKFFISGSRHAD